MAKYLCILPWKNLLPIMPWKKKMHLLFFSHCYVLFEEPPLLSLIHRSLTNFLMCWHVHQKEIMSLKLLVPFSPNKALHICVVCLWMACPLKLTMLFVQSLVNLITQPPWAATGRSATCLARHWPSCYRDVLQTTKQIHTAQVSEVQCMITIYSFIFPGCS